MGRLAIRKLDHPPPPVALCLDSDCALIFSRDLVTLEGRSDSLVLHTATPRTKGKPWALGSL